MSVDKLVDSTQLDADLTSVANAIRTKGGTSADLAFPSGFISAVEAIETGGGVPDKIVVDLASAYEWEIGAVGGGTGTTYESKKENNNARLRGVTLVKTNNISWLLSANFGDGEWVVQYARYNSSLLSTSSFTVLTSDTVLTPSPYIALVVRHSNGTTAMNVSDIDIVKPKLSIDLDGVLAIADKAEAYDILMGVSE